MRVDVDRVNLILNLDEKQLIKFGQLNQHGHVKKCSLGWSEWNHHLHWQHTAALL